MNTHCVYAIVTGSEGDGASYFKIGRSNRIETRIRSVQTGCPFPIQIVLHLPVPTVSLAVSIEGRLHKRLAAFHTSGEWFRFNLSDPTDKIEFRLGCDEVIRPRLGEWKWAMYEVAAIEQIGAEATMHNRRKRVGALIERLAEQDSKGAERIKAGLSAEWWEK